MFYFVYSINYIIVIPFPVTGAGKNDTEHICSECNSQFPTSATLQSHLCPHSSDQQVRLYVQSYPFECNTCAKRFKRKNCMSNHKKIHNNDRPYECHVCFKPFTHKKFFENHLKAHARTHSACLKCGDIMPKEEFAEHKRNHFRKKNNMFVCKFCGKSFFRRCRLMTHEMTHTIKD